MFHLHRGLPPEVEAHHGRAFVVPAGNFQQVHPGDVEPLGDDGGLFNREPTLLKIGRIQLDRNGVLRAHRVAHGLDGVEEKAGPVFERAPECILPGVGEGVQKRREEVPNIQSAEMFQYKAFSQQGYFSTKCSVSRDVPAQHKNIQSVEMFQYKVFSH